MIPSVLGLENSLTVYNAASRPGTLAFIIGIAAVGLPIILGYTFAIYRIFRIFRGPVRIGH